MPIPETFETELTKVLGIRYPIMCTRSPSFSVAFRARSTEHDALDGAPNDARSLTLMFRAGAGMGHVTGAELAAAVSNAGGIGTIGAIGMSPEGLRAECKKLVSLLKPGE